MATRKYRKRRNKKPNSGSASLTVTLEPGEVPSDEELEAEARAIDDETQGKYDLAKQDEMSLTVLQKMSTDTLTTVAKDEGIEEPTSMPKQKLVFEVLKARARKQGLMMGEGTLAIIRSPDRGDFGFLRSPEYSYLPSADDVYVSPSQIRRFGLRPGHIISGLIRPPKEKETYFALLRVEEVNGKDPAVLADMPSFPSVTRPPSCR